MNSPYSFIDIFGAEFGEGSRLRKIVIPIIQRDYAQGRENPEVERVRLRFLEALRKAVTETPIMLDFIYGDVDSAGVMTPLDGQQRLTTLFLLHWYAAKKENVSESEFAFLKNFSYETRYSARDFCTELVDFKPSFAQEGPEKPSHWLSLEIIDQAWFPLDWKKDPTIRAMLVMLDAIDEEFGDVPNLWEKLCCGAVTFYFLPIREMGLTDELYIKMNSRGKPLTQFEHFKAELERTLRPLDAGVARRIGSKIDLEWTDLLWRYRNGGTGTDQDYIIDDEFLRYFRFVCDVIRYEHGEAPQEGRAGDEFWLLETYFSGKNPDALKNLEFLERCFDCWCEIPNFNSPAEFCGAFMSQRHENGHIVVDGKIDIFEDCLRTYGETFPLNRTTLLYGILIYLLNQGLVTNAEFSRRIRIVNNLIRNSKDELREERMSAIFRQTKSIILEGKIDDGKDGFNRNQMDEEIAKAAHLKEHPEDAATLFELEDHPLLYGQIGIVGLSHIDYVQRFLSLFKNCSYDKIDCALMSLGNYGQQTRSQWLFASGGTPSWVSLFHRSANLGFYNTSKILIQLLSTAETFYNVRLQEIIDNFIKACEERSLFPWRYYYVKYGIFRPQGQGIMKNLLVYSRSHMFLVLTSSRETSNSYMPYLKEADPEHLSREHNGQRLVYADRFIICTNNSFVVCSNRTGVELENIKVSQNSAGIDTENRIEKLRAYLKEHAKR